MNYNLQTQKSKYSTKRYWSQEDRQLRDIRENQLPKGTWGQVSQRFNEGKDEKRSNKQCSNRWRDYLNPKLKNKIKWNNILQEKLIDLKSIGYCAFQFKAQEEFSSISYQIIKNKFLNIMKSVVKTIFTVIKNKQKLNCNNIKPKIYQLMVYPSKQIKKKLNINQNKLKNYLEIYKKIRRDKGSKKKISPKFRLQFKQEFDILSEIYELILYLSKEYMENKEIQQEYPQLEGNINLDIEINKDQGLGISPTKSAITRHQSCQNLKNPQFSKLVTTSSLNEIKQQENLNQLFQNQIRQKIIFNQDSNQVFLI